MSRSSSTGRTKMEIPIKYIKTCVAVIAEVRFLKTLRYVYIPVPVEVQSTLTI